MNLTDKISKHFTWKDALWLPTWNREANEKDGLNQTIIDNLKVTFEKMDLIRDLFNKPVHVHVAYRPPQYNKLIGGASSSSHTLGMACDFDVLGVICDEVRLVLVGKLDEWLIRMENKPKSNWVHIDTKPLNEGKRFFIP